MSGRLTKRLADLERSSGTEVKGPEIIYFVAKDPPATPPVRRSRSGPLYALIIGFRSSGAKVIRGPNESEDAFAARVKAKQAELKNEPEQWRRDQY